MKIENYALLIISALHSGNLFIARISLLPFSASGLMSLTTLFTENFFQLPFLPSGITCCSGLFTENFFRLPFLFAGVTCRPGLCTENFFRLSFSSYCLTTFIKWFMGRFSLLASKASCLTFLRVTVPVTRHVS